MPINILDLKNHLNKTVKVSPWMAASQEDINAFGKLSGDNQWIHTDPEKCALYAPSKTTIVHGIYWISRISPFLLDLLDTKGVKFGLNYGYDKIRFIEPVKVNEEVQMSFVLSDIVQENERIKFTISTTIKRRTDSKVVAYVEVLNMVFLA